MASTTQSYDLTKAGQNDDEKSPSWKILTYNYTQDTTFHGVRYVTTETVFRIRRVIWSFVLLGALGLFLKLVVDKVIKLQSHPKTVNVEVNYNESIVFPAVTICNSNPYILTALQEEGLYDLLHNVYPYILQNKTSGTGQCVENYTLHLGICGILDKDSYQRKSIVGIVERWLYEFGEVNREVCQHLCSQLYDLSCNSVLYNRDNRSCVLSSYAGTTDFIHCTTDDNPFELYLKHKCVGEDMPSCDFEHDCVLHHDRTADDLWKRVEAWEVGNPNTDNTMATGSGHYLYLLDTDKRQNYDARYFTDYLRTTEQCLRLAYFFLGKDNGTRLSVIVIGEDKTVKLNKTVYNTGMSSLNTGNTWYQLYADLPPGSNIVILEGVRGPRKDTTAGIAVDDLNIFDCVRKGEDCITTRLGKGYIGPQYLTNSGKECVKWSDLGNLISPWDLPDATIVDASNYCRSRASLSETPGCYVNFDVQSVDSHEDCDVPYCKCKDDEFKCANSFCLANINTCDGFDDCGDASDEWEPCADKRNISCHFDDPFICGYVRPKSGTFYWRHVSASDAALASGNINNHHPQAENGHKMMMLISSSRGQPGDRAYLVSPIKQMEKPMKLNFYIFMNTPENDIARFEIYKTENGVMTDQLLLYNKKHTEWQLTSVILPEGKYLLTFVGVMGTPFISDIGFASVYLTDTDENPQKKAANHSATCNGNFVLECGYSQFGSSFMFKWEDFATESLTLAYNISDVIPDCGGIHMSLEGTITSPNFPHPYQDNELCKNYILLPAGYKLNLTFTFMDVEAIGQYCEDYLQIVGMQFNTSICGCQDWPLPRPIEIQNGPLVIIVFYSNHKNTYRGFNLKYSQIPLHHDNEIACGSKYSGVFTEDEYSTYLSTPSFEINTTHCLAAVIFSASNLTVYQQIADQLGKTTVNPLLRAPGHLGNDWHRTALELEPKDLPISIWFGSTMPGSRNLFSSAVKSVTLTEGTCLEKYGSSGSIECSFDDIDQCGYVDQSKHTIRWIRTKREDQGVYDDGVSSGGSVNSSDIDSNEVRVSGSGENYFDRYDYPPFDWDDLWNEVWKDSETCKLINNNEEDKNEDANSDETGKSKTKEEKILKLNKINKIDCSAVRCRSYDYRMSVMIVPTGRGPAVLMSPSVSNMQTRCLQMDTVLQLIKLDEDTHPAILELNVYIVDVKTTLSRSLLSNITEFTPHSWKLIKTALPKGNFSIKFEVKPLLTGSVLQTFAKYVTFHLANVTILDEDCNQSDIGLTCQPQFAQIHNHTQLIPSKGSTYTIGPNLMFYLGQAYDYYKFLVGIQKNLTTCDAEKKLAHLKESMIVRCGWAGVEDNCEPIQPTQAGAGYCYTFNPLQQQPLKTHRTGVAFGLRLLINVEKYQYTEVRGIADAGIKVHLHMQEDVASVSDLGFAVAPGTNALASVTLSKTHTLEPPWGTCSSIPLYNNRKYSRLLCHQECKTNATIEVCGCREDFIRDDVPECLLGETLNCTDRKQDLILRHQSLCNIDCPEECDVTSLPVSLSYSDMAGETLKKQFTASQIAQFQERYESVVDIRHRITSSVFENTLQSLLNVIGNYSSFYNYISVQVFDESTSVLKRLTEAINKFIEVANQNEIIGRYYTNMEIYMKEYRNTTQTKISAATFAFESAKAVLAELETMLSIRILRDGVYTNYSFWDFFPRQAIQTLTTAYTTFSTTLTLEKILPTNRLVPSFGNLTSNPHLQKQCVKFYKDGYYRYNHKIVQYLENIESKTDEYKGLIVLSDDERENITKILGYIPNLYNGICMLVNCISDYGKFLNAVKTWRAQLDFNTTTFTKIDTDKFDHKYKASFKWLNGILHLYSLNKKTKNELSDNVISGNISEITQLIASLKTTYTSEISLNLKDKIENKYVLMRTQYQEALSYMSLLQDYIITNHLEKVARSIDLWLRPYPVIDSPNVIAYEYNNGEVWRTWPKLLSLHSFQHTIGPSTIKRLVKVYFDKLKSSLTEVDTTIETKITLVSNAITEMQDNFREYSKRLEINGDFIKENFLQLNVFFGELKYESVSQLKGYDIATLFSEIGGYMGLLLGGSVISVVEFLDLWIYNLLRKALERSTNKSVASTA